MSRETLSPGVHAAPGPGEAETAAPKPPALLRLSEYALLAASIVGCADTLRFFAHFFRLPFSVDFEEGNVLNAALRITHGLSPYPPVGGLPYVVSPYGPVFYYVLAPVVKLFGAHFAAPRTLALASALAAALFLVLLLRRWTGSTAIALGFGLSFLAVTLIRDWVYLLRVDLFGLALTIAGLYVFATTRRLALPAILFLAALNSKITLLAAPVACFLYLFLSGDRRRAWRFTGWMLLFGTAGLAALGIGTRGWGLFHMFLSHPGPYSLAQYVRIVRPFALLDVALIAGVVALAVRDIRRRTLSLPLLYALLATVMTLTAGKYADGANHLLEWQAALCLGAGCGYASLRQRARVDPVVALIPLGLVVLVVLGLAEKPRLNPALAGCASAYRFAAQQPGELLAENPGAAVLSGKTVWLSNVFEYALLGKANRLDQRPLTRLVQRKFFGVILLGSALPELERAAKHPLAPETIWPPAFVSALARNYHQVASFACADASAGFVPDAEGGTEAGETKEAQEARTRPQPATRGNELAASRSASPAKAGFGVLCLTFPGACRTHSLWPKPSWEKGL